jgi:cob(I)alamin adenosyltransferase
VGKASIRIEANGAIDEAQAFLGLYRAERNDGDAFVVEIERELYCVMAEVATAQANRKKLTPGTSLVTKDMVDRLEQEIDALEGRFAMPTEFVIPGESRVSALLDVARCVVRRAERLVAAGFDDQTTDAAPSFVGPYLNRLSDLLWMMARAEEGGHRVMAKAPKDEPTS